MSRKSTATVEAIAWKPIDQFEADEKLTASDWVIMGQKNILPNIQFVNGRGWVHVPTIPDWRLRLELNGYAPLRMTEDPDA